MVSSISVLGKWKSRWLDTYYYYYHTKIYMEKRERDGDLFTFLNGTTLNRVMRAI